MKTTLGINEALVLAILCSSVEFTVAEVAGRLQGVRDVNDGSIYVALQRMAERGFVKRRKTRSRSIDGREREIGVYAITGEGHRAVDDFEQQAAAVPRLRVIGSPA